MIRPIIKPIGPIMPVRPVPLAQTEDNTYTLKTLGECDPKTGKYKLFYQNEQAYPGKYILASLSSIQGVAKHVIKAL